MKLVQFWRNGLPALGIQTKFGVIDAAAEASMRGMTVPNCMMELIPLGEEGVRELLEPLTVNPTCFTNAPMAPVVTGTERIFCIGLNYRRHAKECDMALPKYPVLFNKYANALAAHGGCVRLLPDYQEYDYEAELVVVIGKPARDVSEQEALDYVFGYTCGNDLSTRDLQFCRGGQWLLSKTLDGFAPIGPCLVPAWELDPNNLGISSRVNGELRQNSNTSDMIFNVQQIVSDLSHYMTLEPGDLIFTGTPEGVMLGYPEDRKSWLKAGDKVSVTIEGIGTLENSFC